MRHALKAAVLTVVLLGAACGGSTTTAQKPVDVVLASSTKTADAKSAKVALKVDTTGGGATTITGNGAFDFPKRAGSMTVSVPQLGNLDVVINGQVIYEKLPAQLTRALGGKPWIKIDLATIGEVAGIDLSSLSSLQSSDPSQQLAYLKGSTGDVTEVGKETLRGAPTTHYKMTIDLNKAVANAPESARAGLQGVFDMYSSKTLPADVWIDSDGRLRKMQYTATVTAQGHTTTANTVYELYEFGTPVNATPPPANQVSDLQTLLKQSGGR